MTGIRVVFMVMLCVDVAAYTTDASFAQAPNAEGPKMEVPKVETSKAHLSALRMISWHTAIANLEKIEGYYTYKAKNALVEELGAKVVFPVEFPLTGDMVQFRPCGSAKKIPVDHKELHPTNRTCGQGGGIWLRKVDDALIPVIDSKTHTVLSGKKIDLTSFPADYQSILAGAENGELVGYSVKMESGDLTLSVLTKHQM